MRDVARRLWGLLGLGRRAAVEVQVPPRGREPTDHVILIDGTMSSLDPGQETNIGRIYLALRAVPQSARMSMYYEPGVQWRSWRDARDVAMGRGINRQIQRAYGWLATRYRPGDRVFLFGFSRGAFAVRSLAGIIDQVGLLRTDCAIERNVQLAYRYYRQAEASESRDIFVRRFCHAKVGIEMLGVFDTVKALGLRLPFLWSWTEPQHDFHNHALGPHIRNGYHALALDETRAAYDPLLWDTTAAEKSAQVEQVWFRGTHGDIGGQIGGFAAARPLANIPLVWMLEKAEAHGLPLPVDWRGDFPTDPKAPSVGTWNGWGKAFLLRSKRRFGQDPSEALHRSARDGSRGARRAMAHHMRQA
ncbi:DUF2235 domain-containing protein [Defluviimonas sp. WL0002]|uniref:DUF2235 domain-containing protein n=1 Tax=Albidovulum marisflavi TaxID=2984159 RepID=A0ABT2ZAV0_9RHOB|nr:DUF2235 domain-containing protein [Defluviimonas sp. WL0002]MCV2868249.1 DUF2235 domain-containing protein [Defluviimonas sp. WL0002]